MCCAFTWRGAAVFLNCRFYLHFLFINYLKEVIMNDDINLVIQMMDDERSNLLDRKPLRLRRKRKSVLDSHKNEIIQRRIDGKTYRQIADFITATYKVKTDRTLVYDFYKRCISE